MMNPTTKTFNSTPTIVFIDAGVDNPQQLLQGVIPDAKVFILDKTADGIGQISQVLGRYQHIDAVHLISHGAPGCLYLGNTQLSLDTLIHYAPQLQQWNISNLLLYGCNVAAGDAGEEFIAKLHALTGSEIAASKSVTGNAAKGGNWELEVTTSQAELTAAFTPEVMTNYPGIFAAPVLVKDINPGTTGSNPANLADINGTLYFSATDDTNGTELWKSDGTAAGTVMVKDIYSGTSSSTPINLTNVNGTLYFQAYDDTNGNELWKSDGTAAGTVLVKDINSGTNSSYPANLTNINGTLYFLALDGTNGAELWKSDGTAAGTVLVKDINPGTGNSNPNNLTNFNNTLYFTALDGTNGAELWKSDGTAAGTVLVKDINPGTTGSSPANLTNINGTLYFQAKDSTNGIELWKSDGTAAGTVLVKDINPGTNSSTPNALTNVNNILYFRATDSTTGNELWKSDGTAAGTVMVKDINPGTGNSNPLSLTNVNNILYFTAYDGTTGTELWKSDGTAAGTLLVKDISPGLSNSNPNALTNVNGTLYFRALDNINGNEVWKSDGTAAGTVLVQDINPGGNNSNSSGLTNVNGTLYFSADNGINGAELWKVVDNSSPTNIALSNSTINENVAANSTVGTLTSTDPDTGNTFTYSLVTGTGSTDNAAFTIASDQLKINASPNFEAKSSYSIRVRTTDQGGLTYETPFTINIANVNEAPTALALSNSTINENVAANSTIGTLTSTDPDTGNTFTYTLVTGTGSTDNAAFAIVGNQLNINASPNFEAKSSYAIRVRTTDNTGLTYETPLTINIANVNEAPTALALSNTSINENVAANSVVGTLTSTDPDTGNTFTYSLVAGTGSTDNAAFTLVGDQLKINASPDFETKSSYSIRVKTTDAAGLTYEKPLTVTINDLNEDLVSGTQNNDVINGTASADQVNGLAGSDRIYGNAGNDILDGGDGNDIVYGGNDNDLLHGGNGSDRLYGDAGNDQLYGDAGNDILYGGNGDNLLDGGAGSDQIYGNTGIDTFALAVGIGQDLINNFEDGKDKIRLDGGLTFADLKITQSGASTLIKVLASGVTLASLTHVNSTLIGSADFI